MKFISNYTNSIEYRNKIHSLIPGGAHTYSKGDDQFPFLSPAAIEYGKGAHLWDIDGNKFLDCSMGLTSVSLGHAYGPVIERVKTELDKGVNFQRPSRIEKEMAEKFLSLIPCHDMIKFAKNGSSVTTAAVKLARAFTGRKLIAFPKQHPFYSYDDWFIGSTDCNRGVPEDISNLTVSFDTNNLDSLDQLFQKYPNQIACVITEPEKSTDPSNNEKFLQQSIELAHKYGALFILDEMVTGFKTGFPGSISTCNLKPDMATWGKGIANGFSFCALTGIKEVMELGGIKNKGQEKVFLISSTHGGETHAIAAGLATIAEFENNNVLQHLHSTAEYLNQSLERVITEHKLDDFIKIYKSNWMPTLNFLNVDSESDLKLKTLFLQEMIKRGILFQGYFVPCFSHTKNDIDDFIDAFKDSMNVYSNALDGQIDSLLVGEPIKPVFRKYL